MRTTLTDIGPLIGRLGDTSTSEGTARQPLHTVYGGAQLFKADTAPRLGELALRHLDRHAPDAHAFARALGLPDGLADTVYERTRHKLETEPVEDFRIDFEDGFGIRPDDEEDAAAVAAAHELAGGLRRGTLPPFVGIRIKPFNPELVRRSVRTLDLFLTTLLDEAGELPPGFVVTLPKVPVPEQVTACVDVLAALEQGLGLREGSIPLEIMVELTQSLLDREGRCTLPLLHRAAGERLRGAHFGTYDFTASYGVTADHQVMDHPSCDFAKHLMKAAFAGTTVQLSDGATNVMPVGDDATVHAAWRLQYRHIRHSLEGGFYQGWDLHPGQLPVRYAACFTFFLEGLDQVTDRLRNFVEKAAQATLLGDVFDDAATGQGLLNSFLRALASGAIDESAVAKTGLTVDEVRGRSFARILENRRV